MCFGDSISDGFWLEGPGTGPPFAACLKMAATEIKSNL